MKSLQAFLILARKKYLQARSLDYYLQTDEAHQLLQRASIEEKESLYSLLEKSDREGFYSILAKIRDMDLEFMSVVALRKVAWRLSCLDYRSLAKEQLINFIKKRRDKDAGKILENERDNR